MSRPWSRSFGSLPPWKERSTKFTSLVRKCRPPASMLVSGHSACRPGWCLSVRSSIQKGAPKRSRGSPPLAPGVLVWTTDFDPVDIIVDDGYIGEAYGIVSDAGREAMMLLARNEGILLDPVYTSKGMAGLIGHARRGMFAKGANVVFVHTGGLPALFAYAQDLGL